MEIENKTYNGWKNYETWVVKLWLDNSEADQQLQREWLTEAQNTRQNQYWTREETTKFTLADIIKNYVEDCNPLNDNPSMFSDLLNAAISEVDWHEIAENIMADNS